VYGSDTPEALERARRELLEEGVVIPAREAVLDAVSLEPPEQEPKKDDDGWG
jgi:hypothetical protein